MEEGRYGSEPEKRLLPIPRIGDDPGGAGRDGADVLGADTAVQRSPVEIGPRDQVQLAVRLDDDGRLGQVAGRHLPRKALRKALRFKAEFLTIAAYVARHGKQIVDDALLVQIGRAHV